MTLANESRGTRDGAEFVQMVLTRLHPIEVFAKWFYSFLVGVILVVGIAIGAGATESNFSKVLLIWSVALSVMAASTMVGALLGFLFGIPRSLQQRPATPAVAGAIEQQSDEKSRLASIQAFRSNTSLEEISDWLTKIIIGIGLVQFQTFVAYLYKAALLAAAFVAAQEVDASDDQLLSYKPGLASPFFFSLILSSLVAGCLFVYLETRTRLTLLFVSAEKAVKEPDEQKLANSAERPVSDPGLGGSRRASLNKPAPATQDDKDIAKLSREKLVDPKEIVGWALAQARVKNYDVAEDALRDALQKDPENNDIRLRIADVRRLRGNFAGSNDMIEEIIAKTRDPAKRAPLLKQTLRAALYVPAPDGFRQAIKVSEMLVAEKIDPTDPWIYLWRAAAFAQKHSWLQRNAGTPDELAAARKEALDAVRKVVEHSPGYNSDVRVFMREIFDPATEKSDPRENDLEVFKADTEFAGAVYQGKPAG